LVALRAFVALSAVVAEGTLPNVDSFASAPVTVSFFSFCPAIERAFKRFPLISLLFANSTA
jgi:hypothetical protein